MKDRKRKIEFFSFYDRSGMEGHLEAMAAKGWLLESVSGAVWTYRAIAPQALRFAVTYDPAASVFASKPTEEQLAFREFCAHDGWEFAAEYGAMQVFYSREEEPVPLETDETMEEEKLRGAANRVYLPAWGFALLLCGWHVIVHLIQVTDTTMFFLESNRWLLVLTLWGTVLILTVSQLIGYALGCWKGTDSRHGTRWMRGCLGAVAMEVLIWFALMPVAKPLIDWVEGTAILILTLGTFLSWAGIKGLMKKAGASIRASRGWTVLGTLVCTALLAYGLLSGVSHAKIYGVFEKNVETYTVESGIPRIGTYVARAYSHELPLRVEDLVDVSFPGYSCENTLNRTLFLTKISCEQRARQDAPNQADMPHMWYIVHYFNLPGLYDIQRRDVLDTHNGIDPDYNEGRMYAMNPEPWKADRAYEDRLPSKYDGGRDYLYLLCYDDHIVTIVFSWQPTVEQMAIVGEKLGK